MSGSCIGTITCTITCFISLLGQPGRAEDFSAWSHHADLFIDTSPAGANVAGPVLGFPLLVRLIAAEFAFAEARGDGRDIRFATASGREVPYEIERWDSAGGVAEIWVKTDTLRGGSAGQVLKMHWGNADAIAASNAAAVFDAGTGFAAVWHLGGTGPRANAVPGGLSAVPVGYGPEASVPGVIGLADSMSGGPPGGYLDIGDGYGMFASGFTFSAWVRPVRSANSVHFLDLGNGAGVDNIAYGRYRNTDDLSFLNVKGTAASALVFGEAPLASGQWQNIAVTVKGDSARMYRNGALIASERLTQPINSAHRAYNYLGRSNWSGQDYFRGILDEPRLSKVNHGPDWIRLAYETQRPGQTTVSFRKIRPCAEDFSVATADTLVAEGGTLELNGIADCAAEFSWTALEGPAPRILDPEVKSLRLQAPRVKGDTTLKYRFSARFGATVRTAIVTVSIREAIPDPEFSLPALIDWNGVDSLVIKPEISNLAQLSASASPSIRYQWRLPDQGVDTLGMDGALMLTPGLKPGSPTTGMKMEIGLCLDNGGASQCRQVMVNLHSATVSVNPRSLLGPAGSPGPQYDLRGRILGPAGSVEKNLRGRGGSLATIRL